MRTSLLKQNCLFIIFICCIESLSAQKAPIKFGKVDIEDLKMTRYEPDTSAVAVVLCDYGVFNRDQFEFTRICRIKILKKDGVNYANVHVGSRSDIFITGKTYNLVDGKIKATKMKGDAVFEERVENYRVGTRFSLPDVKVGSVIEYRYMFPGIPYEWLFQRQIPVVWSELRMPESPYVRLQRNFFGFEGLSIVEDYRWVAKDMPAFRKEPYMNSISNYLTRFEIDIKEISFPGFYEEITSSWEEVSETLLKDDNFGVKLKGNTFLNSEAKRINALNLTNLEKAKIAYELVRNELTWNDNNLVYALTDLRYIYNNKKAGNSAEINLILIALLEKMGFKVQPVVLSTRNNGMLSPIYPSLNKLNYVIARVTIEGKDYLLDATDRKIPFGLLPERCINISGRLVDKQLSSVVNLKPETYSKELTYSKLELSNTGTITGDIEHKYYDYAAYEMRKELEEFTSLEEYIQKLESSHAGLSVTDYEFDNIDSIYHPVTAKFTVDFRNDASLIGDEIYINPSFIARFDDNPFKIDERKYPVDFIYPIHKTYVLNMTIPEGYKVAQMPESIMIKLPGNKGSFICSVSLLGRTLQYTYKFTIKDPVIVPVEYNNLKQFYEMIVAKHAEIVILKKEQI